MLRRLVMALVGVLLLAGCQDDPEPIVADPTPSPTVVSSSPAVSESAEPETAEAFIRRWRDLEISMQNSGDSAAYRAATTGCNTCTTFANLIDTYYRDGGFVRTAGEKVKSIARVDSEPEFEVFRVALDPKPTEYATKQGGPTKRLPGTNITFEVTLRADDSGWKMVDYVQLDS